MIVLAKNHEHDAFVGDHRFDSAVANGLHSATVRASCLSGVAVASVVVSGVVVSGVDVLRGRELGRCEQCGRDNCSENAKFH